MEPEFTPHIKTIIANSVSTYETAAANARRNHAMYGRIFTCTPNPSRNLGVKDGNIFKKNSVNCWNIYQRQSAAIIYIYICKLLFNDYRKDELVKIFGTE
jgi:hypothetical protein|nr:MAG TPA: hypothetical protein [Caudoviricetes sp.]